MKSKYTFLLILVFVAIGLLGATSLFAQEKMKYEDYLVELQKWQDREKTASEQIDQLQKEIDELQQQLTDLDSQIANAKAETWKALQTDDQQFRNYVAQLNRTEGQIKGLMNLTPGDLYKRKDEVGRLEELLNELKSSASAKHPDNVALINEIEQLLERLKTTVKTAVTYDMYTVNRGDYLFKISGKRDIYNDPYQWLKIWTKNRDLIRDPDLIHPNWQLKIPRGLSDNEHLVIRGENLSKIAGYTNVYNDPFKWMRLYEANKDVIGDPNLIYPHMIIK